MSMMFTTKHLERIRGVRKADKATNHWSFSGTLPWFDLDNLTGPTRRDGTSFEGIIEVESYLEADFVVLARSDGVTKSIVPQPCRMRWYDPLGNKWRRYVPDFETTRSNSNRPLFVEVKRKKAADRRKTDFVLIRRNLDLVGADFEVWTEEEIHAQPRFRNADLLFPHTAPMEDVEALDRVRAVLAERLRFRPTIGEIREAAGIGPAAFAAVLRLHVRREIRLDLDADIDDGAVVHPSDQRPGRR